MLSPFQAGVDDKISVKGIVSKHELCLHARYLITGQVQKIAISKTEAGSPTRRSGLWETTCFELFLKHPQTSEYLEFNFAPNSDWNAYHFTDYRKEMSELGGIEKVEIIFSKDQTELKLEAKIEFKDKFPLLEGPISAGLSAVIEREAHQKSYWALQHLGPKPDFHLMPSFTLTL